VPDRSRRAPHRSLERRLATAEIRKVQNPWLRLRLELPTHIERDVLERALALDFLAEARNLVMVGANAWARP